MTWLQARFVVTLHESLRNDQEGLYRALAHCHGLVLPREVKVTRELLSHAPQLKVIARSPLGTENMDLEACRHYSVRVIYPNSVNLRSNAEFLLAGLLMMMRRGAALSLAHMVPMPAPAGRELSSSVVGLIGLGPSAHGLVPLLKAFGSRIVGYDPAIHFSSDLWRQLGVEPVSLPELLAMSDAVSLQMLYATRYRGILGVKQLEHCKPGQFWVGLSRSSLFDADALAGALRDGRIAGCLLDNVEPGFNGPDSPLAGLDTLYVSQRQGSNTVEARLRTSWYIAHRMSQFLDYPSTVPDVLNSATMELDLPPQSDGNSQWGPPI